MITLRLDPELEQELIRTARNLGMSKSELIRRSIAGFLDRLPPDNAWQTGKDLFGNYSSGRGNLSSDRKKILREKLSGKRV
ncbi:MAG TPA: CopG family transcriptional regulator [Proteobacteria bacterium]|nr:CopG family transcriptional regulator [Pseudomonadota bacterium]